MYKPFSSTLCIVALFLLGTPAFGAAQGEDQALQSMVTRLSAFFQPSINPSTGEEETKEIFEQAVVPLLQITRQSLTDDQVHTFLMHILEYRSANHQEPPLYDWFNLLVQSFLQLLPTPEDDAVIMIDPVLQSLDDIYRRAVVSQQDMPVTFDWWVQTLTILHRTCEGDGQSIEQSIEWATKFLHDGMSYQLTGEIFHTIATFIMNTELREDLNQTALPYALEQSSHWQKDTFHNNLKTILFPDKQP